MGYLRARGKKGLISISYYDVHGVQREEATKTADVQKAEKILKIREGEIAKGSPVTPEISAFTFEDGAALIKADYKINEHETGDRVEQRITKHLAPWFGGKRLATLTKAAFVAYAAARKDDKAANGTINRELAIVKRIYRLAVAEGKLLAVPAIPKFAEKNRRKGFFERDQFEAIRGHLPADVQPLATINYWTGWRAKSELLPLTWAQVDRDRAVIRLEPDTTKTGEARVFPYGAIAEFVEAIEACWAVHEELKQEDRIVPWVFVYWTSRRTASRGAPIKDFRGAWIAAREAAGHPGRLVHDFRRTAVRNLERLGVSRSQGKALVGHKTDEIYNRYAIVSEADLAAAVERLAEGFAVPDNGKNNGKSGIVVKMPAAAKSTKAAKSLRIK